MWEEEEEERGGGSGNFSQAPGGHVANCSCFWGGKRTTMGRPRRDPIFFRAGPRRACHCGSLFY